MRNPFMPKILTISERTLLECNAAKEERFELLLQMESNQARLEMLNKRIARLQEYDSNVSQLNKRASV